MFISSFRLYDYKSYLDSGELELKPGINLIVGQNDVGKTALLEGLGLRFNNNPHRDSGRGLTTNQQREQESTAEVYFKINNDELMSILRNTQGQFHIPLPDPHVLLDQYGIDHPDGISDVECARIHITKLLSRSEFTFRSHYKTQGKPDFFHVSERLYGYSAPIFPSLLDFDCSPAKDKRHYAPCKIDEAGKPIINDENKFLDQLEGLGNIRKTELLKGREDRLDFGLDVVKTLHQRIYLFHAQRIVQGKCKQEYSGELAPDANNLASFLSNLQKTPAILREINKQLRIVLPQIYEAATLNHSPNYSPAMDNERGFHEILIYQKDGSNEQDAIPLADCGTGVGQVLAILSIVVASKYSRTIIIDEPQSFLHPGAVRKLIDVLKQYPQHQYIISTHSPQLLTTANPATITLITKERGKPSLLKSISPSEQNDLTLCLEELGARLSDVFGADQVLWVEGKTEAKCFPLIVEKLLNRPLLGTAIVHVDSTGNLEGKYAERVIKIYERLSEGAGLIPRTLGFIFDRENRTQSQIYDIEKRLGGNRVRFLGRTMIENYFLSAKALTEIMLKLDGFDAAELALPKVEEWLKEKLAIDQDKRYFPHGKDDKQKQHEKIIHGGHLLEDLFAHFSEKRVEYDKPRHGLILTEWFIDHQPEALTELKGLLAEMLAGNQAR